MPKIKYFLLNHYNLSCLKYLLSEEVICFVCFRTKRFRANLLTSARSSQREMRLVSPPPFPLPFFFDGYQ